MNRDMKLSMKYQSRDSHFAIGKLPVLFHVNVPYLYLLKMPENQRFFYAFRGYRNRALGWNGLREYLNPLSADPTKWSNTLKQFVDKSRLIVWVCLTILWGWRLRVKTANLHDPVSKKTHFSKPGVFFKNENFVRISRNETPKIVWNTFR